MNAKAASNNTELDTVRHRWSFTKARAIGILSLKAHTSRNDYSAQATFIAQAAP
jgi:hypothetical protein